MDDQIAIKAAMQATSDRLWEQWHNESLWKAIFSDLPKNEELLVALKQAVKTFYEHPTNAHFGGVVATNLKEHQEFTEDVIHKSVGEYITTLTEELALADAAFRENVRSLADLQMVQILSSVEQLLTGQKQHNDKMILSSSNVFQEKSVKVSIILEGIINDFTLSRKQELLTFLLEY